MKFQQIRRFFLSSKNTEQVMIILLDIPVPDPNHQLNISIHVW